MVVETCDNLVLPDMADRHLQHRRYVIAMIRGPLWDGMWILSGPLIGFGLAIGNPPLPWLLAVFLALNSGHLLAPVAMAWCHGGFRQHMLARKVQYILIPIAIIMAGGICGATVGKAFPVHPLTLSIRVEDWTDYARPLVALFPIYFVWNAYHFCMQNYGILRLYRPSGDRGTAMQWAMFSTLFGLIVIPTSIRQPQLSAFCFGAVIINHQLAAIGLSSHVWANGWDRSPLWFASALIAIGAGLAWLMLNVPAQTAMVVIGLRVTAGFVHFLYDRWVWRLSDPQVRATIGQDLLKCAVGQS
jgi:hypothetical protein